MTKLLFWFIDQKAKLLERQSLEQETRASIGSLAKVILLKIGVQCLAPVWRSAVKRVCGEQASKFTCADGNLETFPKALHCPI